MAAEGFILLGYREQILLVLQDVHDVSWVRARSAGPSGRLLQTGRPYAFSSLTGRGAVRYPVRVRRASMMALTRTRPTGRSLWPRPDLPPSSSRLLMRQGHVRGSVVCLCGTRLLDAGHTRVIVEDLHHVR
jgi:hypothetical protein